MNVVRGVVESVDSEGRYTVSRLGERNNKFTWIDNVKPLTPTMNMSSGKKIGQNCVVLELPLDKFILGFYTPDENLSEMFLNVGTDEEIFWAGEDRILSLSSVGDIGIFKVYRKEDGTVEKGTPIVHYDREDEKLILSAENLVLDLLGSSTNGNIAMEYDPDTGNFGYLFEGKLSINDMSPRFKLRFSNPSVPSKTKDTPMSTDGIFELTVDNSPLPARSALGSVILPIEAITIKMGAHTDTLSGVSISVGQFCKILAGPKVSDPEHMVSIKTTSGASLELTATGDVRASTGNGLASITATPLGNILVQGPLASIEVTPDGIIHIHGLAFDIHTLPGTPGFCSMPICPFTNAPHTTNVVNPIG